MKHEVQNWGDRNTPFQLQGLGPVTLDSFPYSDGLSDTQIASAHLGYWGYLVVIAKRFRALCDIALTDVVSNDVGENTFLFTLYTEQVHPNFAILGIVTRMLEDIEDVEAMENAIDEAAEARH